MHDLPRLRASDRSEDIVAALELLGYAVHDALAQGGGYLGAVDLRNPVDLLREGSP